MPSVYRGHAGLREWFAELRLGQVFWVEGGLIVREHDFSDWDEALRVVGISAEAASPGRGSRVASKR